MFHLDHITAVQVKPATQPLVNSTRSYATAGSAENDTTVLTNDWVNSITDEVLNVVEGGGQVPDKANDNQLLSAIKQLVSNGSKDIITNGSFAIDQRRNSSPELTTNNKFHFIADRMINIRSAPNQTEIRKQVWTGTNNNSFDYCGQIRCVTPYISTSQTDYDSGFSYIMEDADLESLYDKVLTISFNFRANVVGKYSAAYYIKDEVGGYYHYVTQFTVVQADVDQYVTVTVPKLDKANFDLLADNSRSLHIVIGALSGSGLDLSIPELGLDTLTYGSWKISCDTNVNWQVATNNYIQMTGLQIDVGAEASPYRFEHYSDSLAQCQRYFENLGEVEIKGYTDDLAGDLDHINYKVTKRPANIYVTGKVTNVLTGVVGQVHVPLADLGANDLGMIKNETNNGLTLRSSKAVNSRYHYVIENLFVSADLIL